MSEPRTYAQTADGWWLPAVPRKAPIDVRWHCYHEWHPHPVTCDGRLLGLSPIDYDCLNCGAVTDAAVWPESGYWPVRRWTARKIWRRAPRAGGLAA